MCSVGPADHYNYGTEKCSSTLVHDIANCIWKINYHVAHCQLKNDNNNNNNNNNFLINFELNIFY